MILAMLLVLITPVYANRAWEMFGGDANHSNWAVSFAPNYSLYSTSGLVISNNLAADSAANSAIIKGKAAFINGAAALYRRNLTTGNLIPVPHSVLSFPSSAALIVNDKYCYVDTRNLYCNWLINNTQAWKYTTSSNMIRFGEGSPIFVNGKIWVGSRTTNKNPANGGLSALLFAIRENGSLIYTIEPFIYVFPNGIQEYVEKVYTPAISDGIVYFLTDYGFTDQASRIMAVYEVNGSLVWEQLLDRGDGVMFLNTPVIHNEKLFIAVKDESGVDQNDDLIAFNKYDKTVIWRGEMPNAAQRLQNIMPSVYAGKVFVASTDGSTSYLYAFNETNGSLVWQSSAMTGDIQASPTIADSMIIVATSSNSAVYALSTMTGKLQWSYDPGSMTIASTPVIVNGTIYLTDDSGNLHEMKAKLNRAGSITLTANTKTVFNAPEANAYLEIGGKPSLIVPVNGNVEVTRKMDENSQLSGLNKLSKFIAINGNLVILNGIQYAYIKLYYTDDELKSLGLSEQNLSMYQRSGSNWNLITGSGADAGGNFVYANLTSTQLAAMSDGEPSLGGASAQSEEMNGTWEIGSIGPLADNDADLIADMNDNCLNVYNPGQEDGDTDGIGNFCDNCALIENGDQIDTDGDEMGNACDPNDDNDKQDDIHDDCPLVRRDSGYDWDNDGVNDDCDSCPLLSVIVKPDFTRGITTPGLINLKNLSKTLIDQNNVAGTTTTTVKSTGGGEGPEKPVKEEPTKKPVQIESLAGRIFELRLDIFSFSNIGDQRWADVYILEPTRQQLMNIMDDDSGNGVIQLWEFGGCDTGSNQNSVTCQLSNARLQDFKNLLQAERDQDVSEKAADWYLTCLDNF